MDDEIRKRSIPREGSETAYGTQPRKRRVNKKKIIRILTAMVVMLSVVFVVMGAMTYSTLTGVLKRPGDYLINHPPKETLPDFSPLPTMPKDREIDGKNVERNQDIASVLFIGVDTSSKRDVSQFGYQSDMLMLAAINTKTYHTTLISIPRDTIAEFDRLDSKGRVVGTKTDRINAAFSYGGGAEKYSYINTVNAVNRLLGTDVQLYVGINMDGIVAITDAVGGVPITLDADFTSADWRMQKGKTMTLNGEQAELYVRHRKLPGMDGSDISRTKRQLRFVKSFANVVKSKGPETYVISLYNQVQKYVDTNLDTIQMVSLAKLLNGIDLEAMEMISLPGTGASGGKWKLDKAETERIITKAYYH